MSDDCQWVESRLEDFLSGNVDSDTRTGIESHVEACERCRREIEGYAKVDDLVGAYFRQQVARAETAGTPTFRPTRLAAAMAGLGAAALVAWLGFGIEQGGPEAPFEEAALRGGAPDDSVLKTEELSDPERAKPATGELPADPNFGVAASSVSTAPPAALSEFYVMDAAGYSYSLRDYSDSVLVIGVFDESASGVDAFAEAYDVHRSRSDLQFVGVSLDARVLTEAVPFPMTVNRGSSLVDTSPGEFAIITPEGAVHTRGSLDDPSFMDVVAASLEELGAQ